MSKLKPPITKLLFGVIRWMLHPVVVISLFAPVVITLNINLTKAFAVSSGDPSELYRLLDDPWSYALVDFVIQTFTMVLTGVIFVTEAGRALWRFGDREKFAERASGPEQVLDPMGMLLACFVVAVIVAGALAVASGFFAGEETIQLYLPGPDARGIPWGDFRLPPWDSPITWARVAFLVLAAFLSFYTYLCEKARDAAKSAS